MNEQKWFLHQIKHTGLNWDKGIVVKESYEAALQSYHAYLGAYAYGQSNTTNFVSVMITDTNGTVLIEETWKKAEAEQEE